MWDFHSSVNQSHLIDGLDLWGQASMDAEDLAFNNGADTEVIEDLGTIFPGVSITVLANGLVVKAVDCSDLSGFVVASQQSNMSRVLELQAQEQLEGLHRVETSVHKVTHEDVASRRDLTALVEEFEQVVELAMDVSANGHRSLHWLYVAFFDQDFFDFFADDSEFSFRENGSVFNSLKPIVDVSSTHLLF